MEDILNETEQLLKDSSDYVDLVTKLTKEHTYRIDELIEEATKLANQPDYSIDMVLLQICYVKLSTELYKMVDKAKQFDIYSSLAEAKATEAFNDAYLTESVSDNGKRPTIKELEIKANNKSKKEYLVNMVYKSAFKSIKDKIKLSFGILTATVSSLSFFFKIAVRGAGQIS